MPRLAPGDPAPDFTLAEQSGKPFKLSAALRRTRSPHLVYFYPGW